MKQLIDQGIVLARLDYGEADRILTILTTAHGKIRVLAKGVRRIKSKLAGGIELFSVSDISFIAGKGDLSTLISARLQVHYGKIVEDLDRTMLAYELLKRTNRATEDAVGRDYFDILAAALLALNNGLPEPLLELWFDAQLLNLAGHHPNLQADQYGHKLAPGQNYSFDFQTMSFAPTPAGPYNPDHIKLLRLAFSLTQPSQLSQVRNTATILPACSSLLTNLRKQSIRV